MSVSGPRRRLVAFVVAMAIVIVTPLAVTANDAFVDVPESNVHHDNITWLRDTGVTVGCNPPANTQYCPEDSVSRAQMATFMRRLAENQVVDAATAVTAGDTDTLDGKDGTEYETRVASAHCTVNPSVTATSCGANGVLPDQATVEELVVSLEAPVAGVIALDAYRIGSASGWITLNDECAVYDILDLTPVVSQIANGSLFGGSAAMTAAVSTAVNVSAGSHTLRLCLVHETADGLGSSVIATLTAQWSAGGSVSVQDVPADDGTPLDLGILGG